MLSPSADPEGGAWVLEKLNRGGTESTQPIHDFVSGESFTHVGRSDAERNLARKPGAEVQVSAMMADLIAEKSGTL